MIPQKGGKKTKPYKYPLVSREEIHIRISLTAFTFFNDAFTISQQKTSRVMRWFCCISLLKHQTTKRFRILSTRYCALERGGTGALFDLLFHRFHIDELASVRAK